MKLRDVGGRTVYGIIMLPWFLMILPFVLVSTFADIWMRTADRWLQRMLSPLERISERFAWWARRKIDPR